MISITRRDETNTRTDRGDDAPHGEEPREGGNRQPEMSQTSHRLREQGVEADRWLVPDTHDDIVVSRRMTD